MIMPAGTKITPINHLENKWQLLFIRPENSSFKERLSLWEEQSALFHHFIKNNNFSSASTELTAYNPDDIAVLKKNLTWDIESDGVIVLTDPQGFIALVFSYQDSPKNAFLVFKKLLASH
jgi:hypothetical protein